jgi:phytoene dehydrogenase-like protein
VQQTVEAQSRVLDPTRFTARRCRTPLPESVDVAIVGAGLGGLTAGAYLARQGRRVAVFDSHYVAGGCATMFRRKHRTGAYAFDIGLHYVGDCETGSIPTILGELGVELDWLPLDPDGFDHLIFPDFTFRVPASRELLRERMLDLFPSERRGIDRYVRLLREVDTLVSTMERPSRFKGLRLAWTALSRGRLAGRYQGQTMGAFLEGCTQDPRLRALMCGQHGDYGMPPSEVSCMLHAGLVNHYLKGAYYPRGGGQAIADRLSEVIEDAGGTVLLGRGVEEIVVEGGRAVGVRTEEGKEGLFGTLRANSVLSNADLKATFQRLVAPEHQPREWRDRVGSFRMAGAIFMTFLGVEGDMRARGLGAHNCWIADSYDMDGLYAARDLEGFEARSCYVTSGSLKDPQSAGHAPPGVTSVELMTLVPGNARAWGIEPEAASSGALTRGASRKEGYRRNERYRELKARVEGQLIDTLERHFPGSRDAIVFCESATPVTHTRYTQASEGTGYGLAASPDQFLGNRPGARTPIPGLYLCGASTRSGHGITGAMSSGRKAAKRLALDLAT